MEIINPISSYIHITRSHQSSQCSSFSPSPYLLLLVNLTNSHASPSRQLGNKYIKNLKFPLVNYKIRNTDNQRKHKQNKQRYTNDGKTILR